MTIFQCLAEMRVFWLIGRACLCIHVVFAGLSVLKQLLVSQISPRLQIDSLCSIFEPISYSDLIFAQLVRDSCHQIAMMPRMLLVNHAPTTPQNLIQQWIQHFNFVELITFFLIVFGFLGFFFGLPRARHFLGLPRPPFFIRHKTSWFWSNCKGVPLWKFIKISDFFGVKIPSSDIPFLLLHYTFVMQQLIVQKEYFAQLN